jgi:hypothetical protein
MVKRPIDTGDREDATHIAVLRAPTERHTDTVLE